jgi:hypothetical protein
MTDTNPHADALFGPLDSIILLLTPDHGPQFLRKFMIEHGFVRSEELEQSETSAIPHARRYRLFRT